MISDDMKPKEISLAMNLNAANKSIFTRITRMLKYIAKQHRAQYLESREDSNIKVEDTFKDIKLSLNFIKSGELITMEELKQY